jgi:flagellar export protein FliJ
MRAPDSIQVLLRVRSQREEIEERKLATILKKLQLTQGELAGLSAELVRITSTRLAEIQCILPNTHHQAVEAQSRALWRQCADHAAEIERLKEAQKQQMSAYLTARRQREVVENLNKQRSDAIEAERGLREQKLIEDLFLARRVAKRDTLP